MQNYALFVIIASFLNLRIYKKSQNLQNLQLYAPPITFGEEFPKKNDYLCTS